MKENKTLVQEALIQMKQVEDVIAENAKGILASTMKEEINQLVKESLSEQEEEDEIELDADVDTDADNDEMEMDMDMEMGSDDDDMEMDMDMDMDSEESPIDLTGASDEEILRVFKAMGEDDGIIVKKDGENIHLSDDDADVEYLVKLGESEEDELMEDEMSYEETDESVDDVINAIFSDSGDVSDVDSSDVEGFDDEEEVIYEITLDEFFFEDGDNEGDEEEEEEVENRGLGYDRFVANRKPRMIASFDDEHGWYDDIDRPYRGEFDFDYDEEEFEDFPSLMDKYGDKQLWFDPKHGEKFFNRYKKMYGGKPFRIRIPKGLEEEDEMQNETYKPKGVGMGSGPKFSYKDKAKGGFNEKKKEGPKSVGTGKAKFEYKKGENMEGKSKTVKAETKEGDYGMNKGDKSRTHKGDKDYTTKKGDTLKRKAFEKEETKEAARTYGMGSKEGRGLRKGITNNRNYVYGKGGVKVESTTSEEVRMLREKNEEYRKALNVFREKLNEVAIFNSNLAYATRLFTEHSTTKKEKLNILRRFDDVETLKESKNLYKSIKEELSKVETKSINESVGEKLNKTVSTGSSTTLIESKTYENPQFLRMKDLMGKIS